jgi:hypothetical protein
MLPKELPLQTQGWRSRKIDVVVRTVRSFDLITHTFSIDSHCTPTRDMVRTMRSSDMMTHTFSTDSALHPYMRREGSSKHMSVRSTQTIDGDNVQCEDARA